MARTPVTQPETRDHEWFESGAGGDINDPPAAGLMGSGYTGTDIPDARDHNFLFREHDRLTRFFLQRGLPNWSSTETYQYGDFVRYVASGVAAIYMAIAPVVGAPPTTNIGLLTHEWDLVTGTTYGTPDTYVADDMPVQVWRNANGYRGNYIDRLGFMGGARVQNWVERWRGNESGVSFLKTDINWSAGAQVAGGSAVTDSPIATGQLTRALTLGISTGGTDAYALVSEMLSVFATSVDCALEGWVVTDPTSPANARHIFGLYSAGDFYAATNAFKGAAIYKAQGNANWQCITGDGVATGTPFDSGVSVTAATEYVFRIEWIGSSKSSAGANRVRFYIGGQFIKEMTTSLPTGGGISILAGIERDTGTVARTMTVRPLRFSSRF